MAAPNKTVIGSDGILRSSVKADFDGYPKMETSFAKFMLDKAKEKLEQGGDKVLYRNADLALRDLDQDDVSKSSISLSTFIEKSKLLSKAFYSMGLGGGDFFALYLPNSTEYHPLAFGALLCGATISPADYTLTSSGIASQLEMVKPKVIVCYEENLDKIKLAIAEAKLNKVTKIVLVSLTNETEDRQSNVYSYSKLLVQSENLPEVPEEVNNKFEEEKVPVLFWSSGTTGKPKAIQYTNRLVRWNIRTFFFPGRVVFLNTTCFFHAGGLFHPIMALSADAEINFFPTEALETKDGTRKLFRAVETFKPVFLVAGSHHVMRAASEPKSASDGLDLSSVMYAMPTGSEVPPDTFEKLKRHFPKLANWTNVYGLTEVCNPITMSNTPKQLGVINVGTEAKIASLETEEPLGVNEVGEIMARYPYIIPGYLNSPEEDAKFFGKDGFVHTGDLGRYDEEGILHFEGRLKDTIKFRNIHISPVEIENVLAGHPGVREVGVFGMPSQQDQEHVAAVVVKNPDVDVSVDGLKKLVEDNLEESKHLRGGVFFKDSLPRNPQGKLLRKKLIELVTSEQKQ